MPAAVQTGGKMALVKFHAVGRVPFWMQNHREIMNGNDGRNSACHGDEIRLVVEVTALLRTRSPKAVVKDALCGFARPARDAVPKARKKVRGGSEGGRKRGPLLLEIQITA